MIVLYIGGAGRSGSTLLEMLLGNVEGFFSVGEVRFFWHYVSESTNRCGCGELVTTCPFWSGVLDPYRESRIDLPGIARVAGSLDRTRMTPLIGSSLKRRSFEQLKQHTERLYQEIWRQSDRAVIVDSSKVPSHLRLLLEIPSIDVRLLHLVRDGRAVAYAWSKRVKKDPGVASASGRMLKRAASRAMITWLVENFMTWSLARRVTRRSVLRYEDFVAAPSAELGRVLAELGLESGRSLPHYGRGEAIDLRSTHSVGGNPIRFDGGVVRILPHEEWKEGLSRWQRASLSIVGAPALVKFGYPLKS